MVIILYLWYIQNGAPKLLLMAQPLKHPQSESGEETEWVYSFNLGARTGQKTTFGKSLVTSHNFSFYWQLIIRFPLATKDVVNNYVSKLTLHQQVQHIIRLTFIEMTVRVGFI